MSKSSSADDRLPPIISELARKADIEVLGVVSAQLPEALRHHQESLLHRWLAAGNQGSMDFLNRHAPIKFNPQGLLPGCQSVVLTILPYFQEAPWKKGEVLGPTGGRISRYAWGRDYHKVLKGRLNRLKEDLQRVFPGEEFLPFTDAGPIHERFFADAAGLGFTGRHTLLITHTHGSWVFLGGLLTTMKLPVTGNPRNPEVPGGSPQGTCPSSCRRCIEVCPTGALTAPFRIDASRCISYLTIEHKGLIPEELRPLMGDWIFGCDLCQEVCPLNLKAQQTGVEDFLVIRAQGFQDLSEIISMRTRDEFVRRFAGTPVMRAGREGLVRNACIAAANRGKPGDRALISGNPEDNSGDRAQNSVLSPAAGDADRDTGGDRAAGGNNRDSGDRALISVLSQAAEEDSDAAVRETARWAIGVLTSGEGQG